MGDFSFTRQPTLAKLADYANIYINTSAKDRYMAIERSMQLLLDSLSPKQHATLFARGYVPVTTPNGHEYRVNPTTAYSINLMGKTKRGLNVPMMGMCVEYGNGYLFGLVYDAVYMTKTLLEAKGGEELIIQKANIVQKTFFSSLTRQSRRQADWVYKVKENKQDTALRQLLSTIADMARVFYG